MKKKIKTHCNSCAEKQIIRSSFSRLSRLKGLIWIRRNLTWLSAKKIIVLSNALDARVIRDLYSEVEDAIDNYSLVLAGIGLRTLVEAVCIDQNIKGFSLQDKIRELQLQGLIPNLMCLQFGCLGFSHKR